MITLQVIDGDLAVVEDTRYTRYLLELCQVDAGQRVRVGTHRMIDRPVGAARRQCRGQPHVSHHVVNVLDVHLILDRRSVLRRHVQEAVVKNRDLVAVSADNWGEAHVGSDAVARAQVILHPLGCRYFLRTYRTLDPSNLMRSRQPFPERRPTAGDATDRQYHYADEARTGNCRSAES
jgi:hypothetical protein